jgi:alpha-galactosidase
MGYRVFKCDFLYAATLPAARYNPATTRAEALRIGLKIIREAIGDENFLLGCGCPIMPAVGLVDAMRIGPDVAPIWDNWVMEKLLDDRNALCTHHNIINTINRAFMHNRLFVNDPDCVLVREDRNRMSLDQIRFLASVIALSGGMFIISDNMQTLSPERLEILRTAMSRRAESMEVVAPFRSFEPDVLVGRRESGLLFGIFNFSNKTKTRIFDLKELMSMDELGAVREIRDVWDNRELTHQNGLLRIGKMERHSAKLIEVLTAGRG